MQNIKQIAQGITSDQATITAGKKASDLWIVNAKWTFYNRAKEIVQDYKVDSFNSDVITNLIIYFGGFEGKYDLKKGIYLYGPLGSGKTIIMKIMRDILQGSSSSFRFTASTDIVQYYIQNGNIDLYYQNKDGLLGRPIRLCIDELGAEIQTANYFGTPINVLQEVLQNRYYLFQDGILTHATSNVTPSEVSVKYGDRVKDRMREMFNVICLNAEKSRRI